MTSPRIDHLQRELNESPEDPLRMLRLADALTDAGELVRSIELADRAASMSPGLAMAHAVRARALRRGARPVEAVQAWQRAIDLEPRRAEFQSGLGAALAAQDRTAEAAEAFERAVTLAPGQLGLRHNVVLFLLQHGMLEAAGRHLLALRAAADLPDALRRDVNLALAALEHGRQVQSAMRDALREGRPDRLRDTIAQTNAALLRTDERLLARLLRMARETRVPSLAGRPGWAGADVPAADWPLVEAHFEGHFGDRIADLQASIALAAGNRAAGADAASRDRAEDLRAVARAVRERDGWSWEGLDEVAWDCRIRYFHALMNARDAGAVAGRFKAMPNKVRENPDEPRGHPAEVSGTLRAFPQRVRTVVGPGVVSAALWIYLFAKLHPFGDGNGGMGRFMASGDLVACGLGPLIVPDVLREPLNVAIRHAHRTDDACGLVTVIMQALEWRDALAARLAAAPVGGGDGGPV